MLDSYIKTIQRHQKHFIVYSDVEQPDLIEQLQMRNVRVEHKHLPSVGLPPFVVIREDGDFVGALSLESLGQLLAPPVVQPGECDDVSDGYRAILELLQETVFTAFHRRQLLATSREFEDRALRVGEGRLYVTFQSLSVFATQLDLYTTLGEQTALDIHIYGRPDWTTQPIENITYHADRSGDLTPFWCMAFDGGGDDSQACVLIAREEGDEYTGFWSYDHALVTDVLATLETAQT